MKELLKKIEDDLIYYNNQNKGQPPAIRAQLENLISSLRSAYDEVELEVLNTPQGEAEDRYHK